MSPQIAAALETLQSNEPETSLSAITCRVLRAGLAAIGEAPAAAASHADARRRQALTQLQAAVQTATEIMRAREPAR